MDTTPVLRRTRSKLSRRDRGLGSPSPMAVCAPASERQSSSDAAFSTPLRAPPADSACWDSPVSPFSPPPLSQVCEVYWEDEVQSRTIEALKRTVNLPGDRVPPLPAPLVTSPAPLLPVGRRRMARATRQQRQQVMALLETTENMCRRDIQVTVAATEAEAEVAAAAEEGAEVRAAGPPPAESSAPPEIESDPELDRSLLRCSQLAEQAAAAPATTTVSPRRSRSFNAYVMEAMPDDEDDIFSQIPVEALEGSGSGGQTTATESSSGVSSGSSAQPRPAGAGRGLPRTASAPEHRPTGGPGGGWSAHPGARSGARPTTAGGTVQSAAGRRGAVKAPAAPAPAVSGPRVPVNGARLTAASTAAGVQRRSDGVRPGPGAPAPPAADPARQKAEINRRRAEALRRRRQNQRARSASVLAQTR